MVSIDIEWRNDLSSAVPYIKARMMQNFMSASDARGGEDQRVHPQGQSDST